MDDLQAQQLIQEIATLKSNIASLQRGYDELKNKNVEARVRILNFEGMFKTLSAAPSATDFQNGSLLLTDIGGTRKINVVINGAVYSVTVT